jgi:hypothetical protein
MRATSAAESSSRCRGGPAAPVPERDDTVYLLSRLTGRVLKDVKVPGRCPDPVADGIRRSY